MMTKFSELSPLCLAWAFMALVFTACSDDTAEGNRLPAGQYPMTFTASVNGPSATRTAGTADGMWTTTDRIAVQVGKETKEYIPTEISGNGATLTADPPFYWEASTETKNICAWYCGDGSTASGGAHATAVPALWAVKSDQSGIASGSSAESPDGYQQSDFLYAAKTISFSDPDKSLAFVHQTARVVINILDPVAISGVVIGCDNNLLLSGTYTEPGSGSTTGTWTPSTDSNKGTIIPREITSSADGGSRTTYAALVIPQNMADKKFIAITLTNGDTYYYIPKGTEADLKSGNQHTYNMKVRNGSLEEVDVVTDGGAWGTGSSENVTGKTAAENFGANDLKVGDYYYSDGLISDGGYRKYTDGTTTTLDVQPVLINPETKAARTCLGIVLKVGKEDSGSWADDCQYKNKSGGSIATIRGYVLALYDANDGGSCSWGSSGAVGTSQQQSTGFYGYEDTQKIKEYATANGKTLQTDFPAAYWATEGYETSYPAPSESSGWFLPSGGQCMYWCQNGNLMLGQVKKATGKSDNSWQDSYWSSSENDSRPLDRAWYLNFNSSVINWSSKSSATKKVRPYLVF